MDTGTGRRGCRADGDEPVVIVAPPPPRRSSAEALSAVNWTRQDIEGSFEVRGGSMFADLLTSPRYKRLAADGESLQLPTSRRFYEPTSVLLHEIRYATVAPAARPFAWPFTVRQDSTSREEVHQPPRGVLLAGGGVATSASILSVADAAAAAAVAGLGCLERLRSSPRRPLRARAASRLTCWRCGCTATP